MSRTTDQFDGTFSHRRADQLQKWDVTFEPVRQILDVSDGPGPGVRTVHTSLGPETYGDDVLLWVFRPTSPDPAECPACGADPGQPCDPAVCLGLAVLVDNALELLDTAEIVSAGREVMT